MTGNVDEWTNSRYSDRLSGGRIKNEDFGPKTGTYRVIRGGSWINTPAFCRAAFRSWGTPDNRFKTLGFRVLMEGES